MGKGGSSTAASEVHRDRADGAARLADGVAAGAELVARPRLATLLEEGVG